MLAACQLSTLFSVPESAAGGNPIGVPVPELMVPELRQSTSNFALRLTSSHYQASAARLPAAPQASFMVYEQFP